MIVSHAASAVGHNNNNMTTTCEYFTGMNIAQI